MMYNKRCWKHTGNQAMAPGQRITIVYQPAVIPLLRLVLVVTTDPSANGSARRRVERDRGKQVPGHPRTDGVSDLSLIAFAADDWSLRLSNQRSTRRAIYVGARRITADERPRASTLDATFSHTFHSPSCPLCQR